MQKLDKVAIAVAGLIILGGIIFTFLGADPGKESAKNISEYAAKIESTKSQQDVLPRKVAPDVAREVRARFSVDAAGKFPEWSFHRRPAEYTVKEIIIETVPTLSDGAICKVETMRVAPSSVVQKVSGLRGTINEGADMVRETLEMRAGADGEWLEVGNLSSGESGEMFEITITEDLVRGVSYQYRLVSTAKTKKTPFAEGISTKTVTSGDSGLVPVPSDAEWECTQAQPGGLVGGAVEPGRATITRFLWDWDKMKAKRQQHFAVEGDNKKILDSEYELDIVNDATSPATIVLRGPGRSNKVKLSLGERAPSLEPQTWTSDDPACTGGGESDEGDTGSSATNNTPDPVVPPEPDDGDAGGLFGDD